VFKRLFLILNSIGALWLAFGAIYVQFHWPRIRAFPFPLIGDWLGEAIAAIWVAGANLVLGLVLLVLLVRREDRLRPPHAERAHRG
jgi:hypothetical protein